MREISVISLSEIAIQQIRGSLHLGSKTSRRALPIFKLRILPYSAEHAFALYDLPLHHPDPFNRQILSQALVEQIGVITCDSAFKLYKSIDVIW